MHYVKFLKLLKIFEVTKLIELAERIKYRQSLLNRLNRTYSADPTEIVWKGTFQICRCYNVIIIIYYINIIEIID